MLAAFDDMSFDDPEPGERPHETKVLFRINTACVLERNPHIVAFNFQHTGPCLFKGDSFGITLFGQSKHGIEMCLTSVLCLTTYIELFEQELPYRFQKRVTLRITCNTCYDNNGFVYELRM